MDEIEYRQTQEQIGVLARVVQEMPLDDFVAEIDRSHGIAPIVDPTLYRSFLHDRDGDGLTGSEKMEWLKRCATHLRAFQAEVRKMRDRIKVDA